MKKEEIRIGEKFGRLTVLEEIDSSNFPNKRPRRRVLCRCECGREKVVILQHLKEGRTMSCGCLGREIAQRNSRYPQGFTKSRLYRIWSSIKSRCKDKKNSTYGGRGISVCEEWRNDYLNFYHWANNNGYNDTLTIDRIDVNGNYEPSNCRWVNYVEQNNNRRSNTHLSYNGEVHTIAEWARLRNLNPNMIIARMKLGWDDEKVLTYPIDKKQQKNGLKNTGKKKIIKLQSYGD